MGVSCSRCDHLCCRPLLPGQSNAVTTRHFRSDNFVLLFSFCYFRAHNVPCCTGNCFMFITPPRRCYVIGTVCLSVCHSVYEQNNSRTRLLTSTKHIRRGKGVTPRSGEILVLIRIRMWISFSTSVNTRYGLIRYILTRQRSPPHFSTTMRQPQSLK